jgi:hypothetical protein
MKEAIEKTKSEDKGVKELLDTILDMLAETGEIKAILMKRQRNIWEDMKEIMNKAIETPSDECAKKVATLFDIIEKAINQYKKEVE